MVIFCLIKTNGMIAFSRSKLLVHEIKERVVHKVWKEIKAQLAVFYNQ